MRDEESGPAPSGWAARLGIVAMLVLLVGALVVAKLAETPRSSEGSACAPCPL